MPTPTTLDETVAPTDTGHDTAHSVIHAAVNAAALVPVKAVTTSRTLALDDSGEHLQVSSASPVTVTVPPTSSVAFPVGTVIGVGRWGAGTVTVTAGAGVTVRTAAAAGTLRAQYSVATLHKVAADEWALSGDLG